jgi:hypothetical protein
MYTQVRAKVDCYWRSVEALASALMEYKRLTENQAFKIIERNIPEEAKARAAAFLSQDPQAVKRKRLDELIKVVRERKRQQRKKRG